MRYICAHATQFVVIRMRTYIVVTRFETHRVHTAGCQQQHTFCRPYIAPILLGEPRPPCWNIGGVGAIVPPEMSMGTSCIVYLMMQGIICLMGTTLTREIISKLIADDMSVSLCPSITTDSAPPPIETHLHSSLKL